MSVFYLVGQHVTSGWGLALAEAADGAPAGEHGDGALVGRELRHEEVEVGI